jgi:YqaJ-like viral recombinase domain
MGIICDMMFHHLFVADSSKLAGVKAVQWGIQNECDAILEYSEHYGTSVTPNGLFLDECGFLGATPDGVIDSETILEIKCPFKARSKSLEDLAKNDKSFFLGFDDNYFLKLSHPYYHQIQGQLYICNKQVCHLYVWSPSCSINIEIKRDMQWSGNIDILKKFYLDNLSQIVNLQ